MNHYFKLYPGDYMRDTGHLSTEQHGAYFLLMLHYYARGPLPADDSQLRRIMRLELDAYARVWPTVREFFRFSDGAWRHKRIDEELDRRREVYAKQATGAAITNQRRWGSVSDTGSESVSDSDTDALTVSQPEPEPKPYPEPKPEARDSKFNSLEARRVAGTEKEAMARLKELIGSAGSANWGGLWRKRFRKAEDKFHRVLNELEAAMKETTIDNPGGYADDLWERFAE